MLDIATKRPSVLLRSTSFTLKTLAVYGTRNSPRRFNTPPCTKTSPLPGSLLYNVSPASFGLVSYMGFEEMITAGAALPCRKRTTLHTIFDYLEHDTFTVAYRHTPRDAFEEIQRATLHNIRKGQASDCKLYASMAIDCMLTGSLHIRDPYTKSEAAVTFDARVPPPKPLLLSSLTEKSAQN